MTTQRQLCFIIPAYNAGPLLLSVVEELATEAESRGIALVNVRALVVNDGSTDGSTSELPKWVEVLDHSENRGKGAALKTGFLAAQQLGFSCAVTLDADAQHPAKDAFDLALHAAPPETLILSVRDMAKAGAPRAAQFSNRFSNWVLSFMAGKQLLDTQCGLRRYPLESTLALECPESGYAFEANLVLRAAKAGIPLLQLKTGVRYPRPEERVSHFDSVRDPARIVVAVVKTSLFYAPTKKP